MKTSPHLFEEQGSRREGPRDANELHSWLAAMGERLPQIERTANSVVASGRPTSPSARPRSGVACADPTG
ncbi:hypothetical protein ACFYYM_31820 [Streptomyces erythrochromogenes]|uniref:hypothetical protein n=1 Tax=Streptomyces erythrochromogenes TaxID=285574 RepID=UPI0036BD4468